MIDGNSTYIFSNEGILSFEGETLANRQEFELADRCVGSVFKALEPGENIKLDDGYFILDEDLNLIQDWQIV